MNATKETARQEIERMAQLHGWALAPGYRLGGVTQTWRKAGKRSITVQYSNADTLIWTWVTGGSVTDPEGVKVRSDRRAAVLREIVFTGGAS